MGHPSQTLEEVLFYWKDSGPHLEKNGAGPLSPEWVEFLKRELARQSVHLSIRVRSEDENAWVHLEAEVEVGKRTHFTQATARGVSVPAVSGTIQRVGLEHLWMRF